MVVVVEGRGQYDDLFDLQGGLSWARGCYKGKTRYTVLLMSKTTSKMSGPP